MPRVLGPRRPRGSVTQRGVLRQLFNSPHTRLQELGADAAADGGRAGVRLLLRLVYARARHRRIRVSAWQGDGAQLPASPFT